MGKFKETTFSEICDFENGDRGKNYPSRKAYVDKGIPFFSAGNISDNKIDESSLNYISKERFDLLGSGKVRKGDILFCLRGSLGKFAEIEDHIDGGIASSLVIIRPSNKVNLGFLKLFLESHLCSEMIKKYDNGTAQPNLSAASLKKFKIPLPPLPEQQHIVAKLDGLFAKIDQAIGLLEENIQHTKALMGSVLDEEFKKGKEKGWKILKFTEFAFLRHGHQFRRYDFVESGIPVVKIGQCKRDGSLDLSNCNFIDSSRLSEFQEDRIYKDDLLMALTGGTLGKVTWVENDYGDLVQNYRVGNFFNIEGKSIKRFLMYILMSSIFQKLVESKVNQGAQPNIGKENIDNMLVPIPSLSKQKALVEKFDVIMKNQTEIIKSQTQKLTHLKALKSSLLDQAFKGAL